MIRAIIIDDEALARDVIAHYLQAYTNVKIIATCSDGFEGLKAIAQHQPDLIFLDIQMPKINGFEMLELVDHQPAVIFTTAFDEFAIKAFEVSAVDYLLKPIEKARFDQAMDKLFIGLSTTERNGAFATAPLLPVQSSRIVVKTAGMIKIIPVNEVNYLEADDDYVRINTGDFQKNKTMSYFEQTLDSSQFIRIHRSYIINLEQVTKIELKEKDTYVVLLKSDIWLPISKSGYVKLKTALGL